MNIFHLIVYYFISFYFIRKYVNSDISKVINKEGILHGDKICLHSRFNSRIRKYSVEGVRGMILLEVPIKTEEILLPQYYNILRKSCFPFVYQRCSVYQYQSKLIYSISYFMLFKGLLF